MDAIMDFDRWHAAGLVRTACGLVLCAFLSAGCGSSGTPPEPEGRRVAETFLSEIRGDRTDAAWESTTAEFKSDMGRETFQRFVQSHSILRGQLTFVAFQADRTNDIERGACDFQTEPPGSGKMRVLVAREDQKWKVERLIVE